MKGGLCLKNIQASTIYLLIRIVVNLVNTIMFTTYAVYYVNELFVFTIIHVIFLISFGVASSFTGALVSFWAIGVVTSIYGPMFDAWLNQNIKSRSRATVLSIMGQSDAVGQAGGGPLVDLVGTRYTLRAAMIFSGILILPILGVFAKLLKADKDK
jgi:sugar phosphate permease